MNTERLYVEVKIYIKLCAILFVLFISCEINNKPKIYNVTFNANSASGTPPATIIVEDENYENHWNRIKLPDKGNLNYEGKQFYGWNTSSNGTGKCYSANSYLQVFSSIVLYAQWEQFLAPSNLRITSLNTLEWDAPQGYLSNYGIYAESSEYYRVSSVTNDSGITISGGVLDGYRTVYYKVPNFTLNTDTTITVPATGWVKIKP
ncbi:hypothetical protein R84B8_02412 [Treponema sp. R8-4-B8]